MIKVLLMWYDSIHAEMELYEINMSKDYFMRLKQYHYCYFTHEEILNNMDLSEVYLRKINDNLLKYIRSYYIEDIFLKHKFPENYKGTWGRKPITFEAMARTSFDDVLFIGEQDD